MGKEFRAARRGGNDVLFPRAVGRPRPFAGGAVRHSERGRGLPRTRERVSLGRGSSPDDPQVVVKWTPGRRNAAHGGDQGLAWEALYRATLSSRRSRRVADRVALPCTRPGQALARASRPERSRGRPILRRRSGKAEPPREGTDESYSSWPTSAAGRRGSSHVICDTHTVRTMPEDDLSGQARGSVGGVGSSPRRTGTTYATPLAGLFGGSVSTPT